MESVQLKVSIARKQPMLDAATGKSVWGSLGKKGILPFSCLLPTDHPVLFFCLSLGPLEGLETWFCVATMGIRRRILRPSIS